MSFLALVLLAFDFFFFCNIMNYSFFNLIAYLGDRIWGLVLTCVFIVWERMPGLRGLLLLEGETGALLGVSVLLEEHTPWLSCGHHIQRTAFKEMRNSVLWNIQPGIRVP